MTDHRREIRTRLAQRTDRQLGLPRSNYSTPGGLGKEIAAMSQHARDAILEHPAINAHRRAER